MLRRTPLKRGKPLARTGGLSRKTRLKPKRAKPRRGRLVDDAYRAWVATLPCARCSRASSPRWPNHAHHNTFGRGKGQKTNDTQCLPLCHLHHGELHALNGAFKGWTRDELRAWQAEQVAYTQVLALVREVFAAEQAA